MNRKPDEKQPDVEGVGRQSGQQREHGHMNREDQQRDAGHGAGNGDALSGHPDASRESIERGRPGGTGEGR